MKPKNLYYHIGIELTNSSKYRFTMRKYSVYDKALVKTDDIRTIFYHRIFLNLAIKLRNTLMDELGFKNENKQT